MCLLVVLPLVKDVYLLVCIAQSVQGAVVVQREFLYVQIHISVHLAFLHWRRRRAHLTWTRVGVAKTLLFSGGSKDSHELLQLLFALVFLIGHRFLQSVLASLQSDVHLLYESVVALNELADVVQLDSILVVVQHSGGQQLGVYWDLRCLSELWEL